MHDVSMICKQTEKTFFYNLEPLVKEGSRMEGTLDLDSVDLGGRF
jgi:hypothetical protein